MTQRALLFDVGNTRLKWGVLDGERLVRTGHIRHEQLRESGFSVLTTKIPARVDQVLVSNVAGAAFGARLAGVIGRHCDVEVHFAHAERSACGVRNGYRQARRLGVDRWVALIGARAEARGALCVVDAGTAMTIDAMDGEGRHLGGQIIPGLALMAAALAKDTSDIGAPERSVKDPVGGLAEFATSTERAVRAGALNAVCGAIERAVRVMRGEGYRPRIVLTGGDASRILKLLGGSVLHRPHLVLQGLARMLNTES